MEIKIPLFSSPGVDVVSGEPDLIIFYDDYIQKKWKATAKIDGDIPNQEKRTIGTETLAKKHITGTECKYISEDSVYEVSIYTANYQNGINVFFDNWEAAIEVHGKILKWLYSLK